MAAYFSDVTLFDGRRIKLRAGVLVSDGKISWVGAYARAPRATRSAREADGAGKTLTPGLIDCHVHLCFDGQADLAAEARDLSPALAALKAARSAVRHIESGVATVGEGGWTPLHSAADNGDARMAELLLFHGADPGALNDEGKRPRDLATASGGVEVLELLRARGA